MPGFLDFFAGSGLVTEGLGPFFQALWAIDVCGRKAEVYRANHGSGHFHLGSIEDVSGRDVPGALLSWGSFPCQDLSLAGRMQGLGAARSGLVWRWLRVMDEMAEPPPLLVAENVVGLVSAEAGAHYLALHRALAERGYAVGAMIVNADRFLPQSRPRVFVVAARRGTDLTGLADAAGDGASWTRPASLERLARTLPDFVRWRLPEPTTQRKSLQDVIDFSAPCNPPDKAAHNLSLIPAGHMERLRELARTGRLAVAGYKRTRQGRQVLELRFDDLAGCLRAPRGGSSRQFLVIAQNGRLSTRLITVREAARLMGAPEKYWLPDRYNDAYHAMGDAVAVDVTRYLARHLLIPLAERLS